jgi:hypothetical protein
VSLGRKRVSPGKSRCQIEAVGWPQLEIASGAHTVRASRALRLAALADYDWQRQRDDDFLGSIALDPELTSQTGDKVARNIQSKTFAARGVIQA